jgi:hypothetical protein
MLGMLPLPVGEDMLPVAPVGEIRPEGEVFLPVWHCGVEVEPEVPGVLLPDLLEQVIVRSR